METITSKELFQRFAPVFHFEKSEEEILALALERGFITPIEGEANLYQVNEEY